MSIRLIVAAAALAAVSSACVDKSPGNKKKPVDHDYVNRNVLAEVPGSLTNEVNAELGGKIVYLGNEVATTGKIAPGAPVKIVHYWKVVQPPGSEWKVFSHVNGAKGEWMNVDYTDMREWYGPAKWKAGDIVRDEQSFALDKGWKSPTATVTVGLYRKGDHGQSGRMPITSGPADKESRVPAVTFQVDASGVPARPSYVIRKASGPIVVDGKDDDAAWSAAPESPDFVSAEGGPDIGARTTARLLWDEQSLYAFVRVLDDDVHSPYTERDDSLWKADVVELFIDADRNRRGYVELQVNPNNAQLDIYFAGGRGQNKDQAWSADMKSAVVVHGTADERGDTDKGWDVEIAIPLAAVKGAAESMKVTIPPAIGDTWALNIVRVEKPKGDGAVRASSWSQIAYADFHGLDRLMEVTFGDAAGKTVAASTPEDVASGDVAGEEKGAGDEAAAKGNDEAAAKGDEAKGGAAAAKPSAGASAEKAGAEGKED